MNDQQLDDLFDQNIPLPDENAKKIAINSAMSEFSQGIGSQARLTNNRGNWFSRTVKSFGSYLMTPQKNSRFNGTTASIAIAFVAVSVYFLMPSLPNKRSTIENTSDISLVTESQLEDVVANTPPIDTAKESAEKLPNDSPASSKQDQFKEITVSGTRATIQSNIDQKRIQTEITDGLSADEIGDIPALSVGEALETVTTAPKPKQRRLENRLLAQSKSSVIRPTPLPRPIPQSEPISITPTKLDSTEEYPEYQTNSIKLVSETPVSTFSIDVDTASYSLIRNQLNSGRLPKPNAVRAEELINYFDYNYPLPESRNRPFEPTVTVLDSPWNNGKKLVHIGIKGYDIDSDELPDSNIEKVLLVMLCL